MKKLALVALLCLLSTHVVVAEEAKPVAELPLTFSSIQYPKFRIGDVTPRWNLKDADNKEIDNQQYLGQSPQLWVLRKFDKVVLFTDWLELAPLSKHFGNAKKQGFASYLIVSGDEASFSLSGTIPQPSAELRPYILKNSLANLTDIFNPAPDSVSIVAIDRAGFIRSIQNATTTQLEDIALPGDPTPKLEVGKPAPDFSIPDMNGIVRRVSDLRGRKNLLLTFFPKCFTGGCTNHLTSIQKEYLSYIATDTEVWAVSVDAAEGEKGQIEFAKRWNLQFPLIPDVGRNVSVLYGAAQNPNQLASRMSVLIDKDGIVRLIDKQVDIYTHGSDMLLQMRRLGIIETPKKITNIKHLRSVVRNLIQTHEYS